MADQSTNPRDRFTAIFQALPLAHKVAIGAALAVVGLAGFLFFNWISTPTYSVLASGIESNELAEITTELDKLAIPYEIEAAGTRVTVVRSELGTARAALAAAGITTSDGNERAGYELLDNQGLAVSSNLERINVQRALEGELARSLREFDRIEAATVHLVIPDTGLFGDPADAEASVILDAASDFSLSEVDAVANLVAGAVENLSTNDVTIVDLQGRTLRAANEGANSATANGRDVLRTVEFEQRLESDITRLLLTAGAGERASVMVRAELNFDLIESRTETYAPDSQVALRESSSTETFTGPGSAAPGGVAGVDGVDTDATDGTDAIDYEKIDSAIEYGIDNVITSTVQAPGEVESLHIGVVIDDGSLTGAAVPSAQVINDLITASLGLQNARGDSLVVTATPFPVVDVNAEGNALPVAATAPAFSPLDLIPQVAGVLAILVAAIGLLLMTRRKKNPELDAVDDEIDVAVAGSATPKGATTAAGELSGITLGEATGVRAEVIDLVQRQPEEIATVLRGWLAGN
jgi:flagellar M-ring protein FliF